MGKGVWRWGKREIIILYLSLHCHHQNDFCIKMGSDESHFNVSVGSEMGSNENHLNFSVGSDEQSHKTVSTNHNLFEEKRAEAVSNRGPSAYQPNAFGARFVRSFCFCLMSSDAKSILGTIYKVSLFWIYHS